MFYLKYKKVMYSLVNIKALDSYFIKLSKVASCVTIGYALAPSAVSSLFLRLQEGCVSHPLDDYCLNNNTLKIF